MTSIMAHPGRFPQPSILVARIKGMASALLMLLSWIALPMFLTGCFEIQSTFDIQPDGSGSREFRFTLVKAQLDQLGPGAAKEAENKLRASLQGDAAKAASSPGGKPLVWDEYVDERGNKVFRWKMDFSQIDDKIVNEDWDCRWTPGNQDGKKRFDLRCQISKKGMELYNGDLPVPTTIRIRMPGNIVNTNGVKRSDNEVEWSFEGVARGTVLTVAAERGLPWKTIGMAGGGAAALAALGGALWYFVRRRRSAPLPGRSPAMTSSSMAAIPAAAPNCGACGTENAVGAKFCRACGSRLEQPPRSPPTVAAGSDGAVTCPNCGMANNQGARFCKSCGTPLSAQSVSTPASSVPIAAKAEQSAVAVELVAVERAGAVEPVRPVMRPPALVEPGTAAPPIAVPHAAPGRPAWLIPAMIVLLLGVVGMGGWVGYTKWVSREAPAVAPQAEAQKTEEPANASLPASSPTAFSPPVPMARDATNGCYVFKPDLQPDETVKWEGGCVGNLADGPGKAEWAGNARQSATFYGAFKAGMLQGEGIMSSASGDRYEGGFVDGRKEGVGTLVLASGEQYAGGWKNDRRDGAGTLTKPDGEKYIGGFKEDRRDGHGVLTKADGTRYEGPFANGEPTGPMTASLPAVKAEPQLSPHAAPVAPSVQTAAPQPAPPAQPKVSASAPPPAPAAQTAAPRPAPAHPPKVSAPVADRASLEAAINEALRSRGVQGITARVGDDLVATLKGSGNAADKDRALQMAAGVKGIRSVRDQVFVVE